MSFRLTYDFMTNLMKPKKFHLKTGGLWIRRNQPKFFSSAEPVSLTWTVDNTEGKVKWILTNNTGVTQSVGILRGVPGYSPIYVFGGAFNMIYLANNMVQPCTSTQQEFCLGIYTHMMVPRFPAFVFNLPPYSQYEIDEYGFPPNPQIVAQVVYLKFLGVGKFVIYYDPSLPSAYYQDAGVTVPTEPDPFSIQIAAFGMDRNIPNEFGYLVLPDSPLTRNIVIKTIYDYLLLPFPITLYFA